MKKTPGHGMSIDAVDPYLNDPTRAEVRRSSLASRVFGYLGSPSRRANSRKSSKQKLPRKPTFIRLNQASGLRFWGLRDLQSITLNAKPLYSSEKLGTSMIQDEALSEA